MIEDATLFEPLPEGREPKAKPEELPRLDFFVACVPPTSTGNQKRIIPIGKGRNVISKTKASKEAEVNWHDIVKPYQPNAPLRGPISLTIELTWPWRKSEKKSVLKLGRAWHDSKPDLDNLSKTLTDLLVRLCFIPDDAEIAELNMRKYRSDKPGLRVVIETLATDSAAEGLS